MTHTRRRYYRTGRKTLRDGKGHGWNWSTPSWWNNAFHTRPQRQATRALTALVIRDLAASDAINWPLPKKPHHYFW